MPSELEISELHIESHPAAASGTGCAAASANSRSRLARPSELFGVDLRSLAAFRIGAATLILADLWWRSRELTAYFTDQGVLPRTARIELYESGDQFGIAYQWSLHMFNGQFWPQLFLLLIAAGFAVCLLVGYRTRLAAVASWLLLLSLDSRNPMILNSGDVLLRTMMFWAIFLPLGARASLDHLLRPPLQRLPIRVLSAASVALLLQLVMMYFFSGLFKVHDVWLTEYSAIYYALNCDAYVTQLGIQLRQFPLLMAAMTGTTFWLELVGPLLAFSPFAHARVRVLLVMVFWAFHLGLALAMTIGLFAPICMVAWLVFLPSGFWDGLEKRLAGSQLQQRWCDCRARVSSATSEFAASGTGLWPLGRPETARWRQSVALNGALTGLLLYTAVWNVRELDVAYWEKKILPRRFNVVARVLGLDQNWSMFSPIPRTEDGWVVMRGTLRDGSEVNLWQPDRPLPWDKPALVSATYLSQRWRKYLDNLTTDAHGPHRMYFADWLQSRWDREHANGDRQREVIEVELFHRIELTPPPGQPIPEPESRRLWVWRYQ